MKTHIPIMILLAVLMGCSAVINEDAHDKLVGTWVWGVEEMKKTLPEDLQELELDPDWQVELIFTRNTVKVIFPNEESEPEEGRFTVADVTATSLTLIPSDDDTVTVKVEFLPDGRMKIPLPEEEEEEEADPKFSLFSLDLKMPEAMIFRRK